ncbi:MAG: LPS-assembly protein LptD [Rickettsiales bacterium]|nr:LPS-assembly protein LptD [Rickettsiales bacterium]
MKSLFADSVEILSEAIEYDNNSGLVKFTGSVEASNFEYNFYSQDILYDKNSKQIFANDDSNLASKNFNLITEKIILSEDFETAEIGKLNLKLADIGNVFAVSGNKHQNDFEFKDVYFTSCQICKQGDRKAPLWHLKSEDVSYNYEKDRIYFQNASFYVFDVPVFYFPFFVANGGKVKKRTGFLTPDYENDSLLGNVISTPLFVNLRSNFDITYTPSIFRDYNVNHNLELRYLNNSSSLITDISYLRVNDSFVEYLSNKNYQTYDKTKWQIKAKAKHSNFLGDYNLSIHRTSASEYSSRYLGQYLTFENSNIDFLSSHEDLFVGYSYSKNFSNNSLSYYRLPHFDFSKNIAITDKVKMKNHVNYDNVNLYDESKRDRISYSNIITSSYEFGNTDELNFTLFNRLDNYGLFYDESQAFRYQIGFMTDVSRDYINHSNGSVITPRLSLYSSNIIVDDNVDNYDSQANQLNFLNLNKINNAFGYDLIDESSTVALDLNFFKKLNSHQLDYKVGFKYTDNISPEYTEGTGLDSKFSDVLNNFSYKVKNFNLKYFNRLNDEDFYPYYNSLAMAINFDRFQFSSSLAHIEYSHLNSDFNDVKNLYVRGAVKLNSQVSLENTAYFSYEDESILSGAMTQNNFAIIYKNQCVNARIDLKNSYYNNSEIKTDQTIKFSIDIVSELLN